MRVEGGIEMSLEAQLNEKQKALLETRRLAAEKRLVDGEDNDSATKMDARVVKKIDTYPSPTHYPPQARHTSIFVDKEAEALLCPIGAGTVPFNILTVKAVTIVTDETHSFLRVVFYHPGSTPKDTPPATVAMLEKQSRKGMQFIRELTFRSKNRKKMEKTHREITDLRKVVRERTRRLEEERDVIKQDTLRAFAGPGKKPPSLRDIQMRPQLGNSRKTIGILETHQNGFRFRSHKKEHLDILFNNIKHCILQQCENDLYVIIHIHLKQYIMVGKKKHKDIQFFTEVLEASQNLDNSRRRSNYDPDEHDEEQRDRALRKRLNEMFKKFCDASEEVSRNSVQFDAPYKELSFKGTELVLAVLIFRTELVLARSCCTEIPY
jgi:nucleosome binding factor SPN SPT16 subunit